MNKLETMNGLAIGTRDLRSVLSPNQDGIESFCWDFQQWLGADVSPKDAFASELLLREALVNAVEHGCAGMPDGKVECAVRGGRGRIFIAVCDPGPGFDWISRLDSFPSPDSCGGRGLLIFRNYATRIRFNRTGSAIFLLLKFDRPK